MLLDLKNVFLNEGAGLHTAYDLDLSDIVIDNVKPFTSPVKADILAENRAGLVTVVCKVNFDYSRPCDRCTADTTKNMSLTFLHNLVVSLSGGNNDDYIETPDYKLDLDELLRADILLELPGRHLCRDDCKGLCPKCGTDLNMSDCDCDKRQIDPRLEVLKKLIDSE